MTDELFKEDVMKYLMHILACLNQIRDKPSDAELIALAAAVNARCTDVQAAKMWVMPRRLAFTGVHL